MVATHIERLQRCTTRHIDHRNFISRNINRLQSSKPRYIKLSTQLLVVPIYSRNVAIIAPSHTIPRCRIVDRNTQLHIVGLIVYRLRLQKISQFSHFIFVRGCTYTQYGHEQCCCKHYSFHSIVILEVNHACYKILFYRKTPTYGQLFATKKIPTDICNVNRYHLTI